MRTTLAALAIALLALASLSGCGGKFSCAAPDTDGIRCTPISKVYERALSGDLRKKSPKEKAEAKKNAADAQKGTEAKKAASPSTAAGRLELKADVPLRVPPRIIRIWFAAWEDEDGDLNQGGYVYSEITDPRNRWAIGEKQRAVDPSGMMRFFGQTAREGTDEHRGAAVPLAGYGNRSGRRAPNGAARREEPGQREIAGQHEATAGSGKHNGPLGPDRAA